MISTILFLSSAYLGAQANPQTVIDGAVAKLKKTHSISGSVVFPNPASGREPVQMRFRFEKPNRFVTMVGDGETRCDGTSIFVLDNKKHEYDEFPTMGRGMPRFAWGFEAFFGSSAGEYTLDHPTEGKFAGKDAVIAEFHSAALRTNVKVAFDPGTNLPLGFTLGTVEKTYDYRYQDLKLEAPQSSKSFSWKPPEDWQKRVPMGDRLLAVGTKAPEFTLSTPGGKKVTLTEALAGKKGLLLNFWFVGCAPCRQEFPHLQSMFGELKGQGFAYLSVNQGDSADAVNKFIKDNHYTFPVALNGEKEGDLVAKYGVPAFPTNLIIAPDRTIIARFVGFDEAGLKGAIRKLGMKLD